MGCELTCAVLPLAFWFCYCHLCSNFLSLILRQWNWMEPPLGTLSFMLLCLQFSRAQMVNLGIRPFTSYIKDDRANRLCMEYPEYDSRILSQFSKTDHIIGTF